MAYPSVAQAHACEGKIGYSVKKEGFCDFFIFSFPEKNPSPAVFHIRYGNPFNGGDIMSITFVSTETLQYIAAITTLFAAVYSFFPSD
tara:strand:+ start:10310 stop:10573 length:264 start_codon:yes stop_codon:yes gene_type:complete